MDYHSFKDSLWIFMFFVRTITKKRSFLKKKKKRRFLSHPPSFSLLSSPISWMDHYHPTGFSTKCFKSQWMNLTSCTTMYFQHCLYCFVLYAGICKNDHASHRSSFIFVPSNFLMRSGWSSLGIIMSPFLHGDVYLYGDCKNEQINPVTSRHLIADLSIISPH